MRASAENRAASNKGLLKVGGTGFYDSFVLNQTLVFQMNSSAETSRFRQAQKYVNPIQLMHSD